MGNTFRVLGRRGKEKRGLFLYWTAVFLRTALALMDGPLGKSGIYVANLPKFECCFLVKVEIR